MAEIRYFAGDREVPADVVATIRKKFPETEQFQKTMKDLKYDYFNNCFYFYWAGMYLGIENDGYIHT